MLLRRSWLVLTFLAVLSGWTTLAQAAEPWVKLHPSNPRYFELAPPGGFPFAIASFGSLDPCSTVNGIIPQAIGLKNSGATYVRLWSWWVCTTKNVNGEEIALPPSQQHLPWELEVDDINTPKWNFNKFDEVYWTRLKSAVAAAQNMNDTSQSPYDPPPQGVRLEVEVQLFRKQDFEGARGPYNPFIKDRNSSNIELGANANAFMKVAYLCDELGDNGACAALEVQKAYVRKLIDVTATFGNVVYEVMNEADKTVCGAESDCPPGRDYFSGYWAQFVREYLGTTARVISHSRDLYAYDIAAVTMVNTHPDEDWTYPDFLPILDGIAYSVRTDYMNYAKVVNWDEMANGERDPARLRKKSWAIIASGGHFHMEDPCNPGTRDCPDFEHPDILVDAKPWKTVLNVNRFRRTSNWQFQWAQPAYSNEVGASRYFYWMMQSEPHSDNSPNTAPFIDHVGYLAFRHAQTCSATNPLLVNLPALPAGVAEYVAWLWNPSGEVKNDNYLKDAQGNRLEYRFNWGGGNFNWCDTPFKDVILARAFPGDDLVFQVHGVTGSTSFQLSVTKAGTGAGTVVSTAPNTAINCGAVCSASYPVNTSVTLSATPNAASAFAGWSGGGCTGTQPTCTTLLSSSRLVTATFNLVPIHTLTVTKTGSTANLVTSTPSGINCGASCTASFLQGTTVTLRPTPALGQEFLGWSGACSGNGACSVLMSSAQSVTANFQAIPNSLTVTKVGTGAGTVTSSPAGISCGTTCSATFTSGTSVILTAAPQPGTLFSGWSGACSGTAPTCQVTINSAGSAVTATFTLPQFALTVTKAGSGAGYASITSSPAGISCGATCSAIYLANTVVTLTANVGPHAAFAGWSGACSGTGACTVTMSQVRNVTATFNFANRPPTCVANYGNSTTVHSFGWFGPFALTISDPDGDSIATCSSIGGYPGRITIGAYQVCQVGPPPSFKFRPVCDSNAVPTTADIAIRVVDPFGAQGICYMTTNCPD